MRNSSLHWSRAALALVVAALSIGIVSVLDASAQARKAQLAAREQAQEQGPRRGQGQGLGVRTLP